jgi:hypothetical protein
MERPAVQRRPAAQSEDAAPATRVGGSSGAENAELASAMNGKAEVRRLAGLSRALNGRPAVGRLAAAAGALNAGRAARQLAAMGNAATSSRPNRTGLPDRLKAGVEALSGLPMDDVRVHYGSPRPRQLQAHAYAHGSDIHLAPGQERHLPHEAWHLVQQRTGRVRPTVRVGGVDVNDDTGLEQEADRMGQKAASPSADAVRAADASPAGIAGAAQFKPVSAAAGSGVVQRVSAETVGKVMFALQDLLKKFQARLTTSLAADFADSSQADKMWAHLDRARAELNRLVAGGKVVPADPRSFDFDRNAPIYGRGGKIYVTDDFVGEDRSLTEQANMLLQLLLPDIPDEELLEMLEAPKEGAEPDDEEISLRSGIKLFRAVKATAARSYILSGLQRVSNQDNWTELGRGFYTSPDREGAEVYSLGLGRPATVIELSLDAEANGKFIKDTGVTDGKTEAQIKAVHGTYDFLTDRDISQVKFHHPFYQDHLVIARVWVQDHLQRWTAYAPALFVRDLEQLRIGQHKQQATNIPVPQEREPGPMHITDVENPTPALTEARDAPGPTMAVIAYAEAAMAFEKSLGEHLASHAGANAEVASLVGQAWAAFDDNQRKKFGYGSADRAGAVGKETAVIDAVVAGGNLRERLTLIYNGYTAKLWGALVRPKELQDAERTDRLTIPEDEQPPAPHPHQVAPELSDREWFSSVDARGKLAWKTGGMKYRYKMESAFQREAEELVAPVSTGVSGTSYGILQVAEKYGVDAQLIRLALLGWMLPAGDHTFHEIMSACALFSDDLAYEPGETRYRHLAPLTEDELRAIAPGKMFPDEVAAETSAFHLLLGAVKQAEAKSPVGAGNLYIGATQVFPKARWTERLKELERRMDALLS